jgi:hypothetical protein
MPHTYEEAVALLANNPNPMTLATQDKINIFREGLLDLANRVSHLEQSYLEAKFRLDGVEARNIDLTNQMNEVRSNYGTYQQRVEVVEKTPNTNSARLDALEPRVRAVEGATGAKNVPPAAGDKAAPDPTLGQRLGLTP